ncbi:MAG: UDP-N-acetylmuramoyl-tripeptide--D-alanyl-D-alanine ligase [Archangium sp.]|nr:UDP-N-acetylmuramoyl-tripeptide--D-alanyl-D-alanine ligase [Archangium sp.]
MAASFSQAEVLKATGAQASGEVSASFDAVVTDSRAMVPGALFVALKGERFDAHTLLDQAVKAGASGVVVQKGHPRGVVPAGTAVFEVNDTLVALGQLARAHRDRFSIPVGAVTGSNGKTTTKELIGAILETRGPALKTQGNLNNEVGVPLTLFNLERRHVAAIVEMGMNHAGEISRLTEIARPNAGLITIVQPAHIEGVGSIEGVAEAKTELFRGLGAGATAIVNADDERIAARAKTLKASVMTFGRSDSADVRLAAVDAQGRDGLSLTVRFQSRDYPVALRLVGFHNAMNAAGAFAMGLALGYRPEECVRGLEAAQAHARRLQLHDAPGGVTVIDDCYNANPASMTAALETLHILASEGRAIAVLGDMLELGSDEARGHVQLGIDASERAARVAFFGPRTVQSTAVAAKKLGAAAQHFDDVATLVAWLKAELKPHDVVLVKGSRGMKLERVVEALTGTTSAGAAH